MDLIKYFSKISAVRALKPINQAVEGDIQGYKEQWTQLIRYEAYCKLTGAPSEMVPSYPHSMTYREIPSNLPDGELTKTDGLRLNLVYDAHSNSLLIPLTSETVSKSSFTF